MLLFVQVLYALLVARVLISYDDGAISAGVVEEERLGGGGEVR